MKDQIQSAINQFNFDRVEKAMRVLNWKWAFDPEYRIPTRADLVATATRLLTEVAKRNHVWIESGGFRAEREKLKTGEHLVLSFTIAQSVSRKPIAEE